MNKGNLMSSNEPRSTQASRNAGQVRPEPGSWWAYLPVALLVFLMSIVGSMVVISANDPGFAVERDYYDKAVAWDEQRAQLAANEALAWTTEWQIVLEPKHDPRRAVVRLRLHDREQAPILGAVVSIEGFHNARASDVRRLAVRELGGGTYATELDLARAGVWEFRLRVHHHGQVYTEVHRAELSTLAPAPHARHASHPARAAED